MKTDIVPGKAQYIYQAPIRIWHWVSAVTIVVLAITGYFIGLPPPSQPGEATFVFMMGWIRLIHFSAAWIFCVGMLFRIYWAFVGNAHSRELFFVPFWRKSWWIGVKDELRWYGFMEKQPHVYAGHNPVGRIAMVFYFWLSVFMIFSGLALYSEGAGEGTWISVCFGWMISLFGDNSLALHYWHRLGMWLTVMFVILHIYTAIREEIMSRQSMVSTMISGWRFYKD